jgi:aspartate kinase
MKVLKFGGASINSIERIKNIPAILSSLRDQKILIVISAMGKTTNALEKVAKAFYAGKKDEALFLFENIKRNHLNVLKYTITQQWEAATADLQNFFTEVEWLLHDKPVKSFDYYYDQIVCIGELLSSTLISYYLDEEKFFNTWVDVRDIIQTDDNFRDAAINWEATKVNVEKIIIPQLDEKNIIITQGFIGCTDENESTTLGREGSDFTAGVFANLLNAESATIWKDVEGVMNADPRDFPQAKTIPELSYKEVVEMAYYGAQVIHPKTIKPLQNKNIPLMVKCFLSPEIAGTVITSKPPHNLPPIVVFKKNQVLVTLDTKDYSFVEGRPAQFITAILENLRVKPNLTQNTAISLFICMDDTPEKIEKIAQQADQRFDVQIEKNLTLLTIRHYTGEFLEQLTRNREIVLQQKTRETIQVLMKEF